MALKFGDGVRLYDSVALKQWKGGETRQLKCIDGGESYNHPKHGASTVIAVHRIAKNLDPTKKWTLYVNENSPMYYGALEVLTKEKPTLEGRTFDITKETGDKDTDTRYHWVEVFEE